MSRVVYLHIGAPKTGTTYLQDRLARNIDTLADHGVLYPGRALGDPSTFHFRAALDLLGRDWGGPKGHARGAWDAMVRKVRRHGGKAIISHEILAPAAPEQVAKAMNDLNGAEIHVVYSARDMARQLPAAWQESIKQGRKWSFSRFLTKVERGQTWMRSAMDLPQVLNTWGAHLPPEQVHVVTVPHERRPGEDDLWHRFCRAFDIDPAWAPLDSQRANKSMGIAETQLIRQLNRRLEVPVWGEATYDGLIRERLAQEVLVARDSIPVRLSPDRFGWAEEQGGLWIDWIRGSGVDVVGDVEDLRPRRPEEGARWRDPDQVRAKHQLGAALDALVVMTQEAASRPDPDQGLAHKALERARRLRTR
jgi:hypothetical protein